MAVKGAGSGGTAWYGSGVPRQSGPVPGSSAMNRYRQTANERLVGNPQVDWTAHWSAFSFFSNTDTVAVMLDVLTKLAAAYQHAGGRTLLVGGTVRDRLLQLPIKDYDLEVFGLPIENIKTVAERFGQVHEVGKAFGILKIRIEEHEIDIAAPRQEEKTGRGHTGFTVAIDPTLSPEQAARRRDFTINAISEDPLTGEIIDPFGGQGDLRDRILRVVDPNTFGDDPLRVLRACQFAARFDLSVEDQTLELLKTLVPKTTELSKERFREEWKKLFLLAEQPSVGLQLAMDIGLFERFPEIQKLPATPQNLDNHPEGNAWEHTLLTVDYAAQLVRRDRENPHDRLVIMLGAWLHDLGKVVVTVERKGKFDARGHAEAGEQVAVGWLEAQGFSREIIAQVAALVREHMHLYELTEQGPEVSSGALRRFVNRLHPATPRQILTVREADHFGRGPSIKEPYVARAWVMKRLQELGLSDGVVPVLRGQDLLELGLLPGPDFGKISEAAERYAERTGASRDDILEQLRGKHQLNDILGALK